MLNEKGRKDVLVVDDLTDGIKFKNIVDLDICDYMDKDVFMQRILNNDNFAEYGSIDGVFHEGASSVTTEWNGKFVMEVIFNILGVYTIIVLIEKFHLSMVHYP
jgi:ADP-L-glycero-D-manno-heptose 6-epimerase